MKLGQENSQFLAIAVLYQVLLFLLILIFFGIFHSFHFEDLRGVFEAWDGRHYLDIAEKGYGVDGELGKFIVFFPGYPFLIRLLLKIGIPSLIGGLLISNLGSVIGHFFFLKWIFLLFKNEPKIAWQISLLFFCSPVAPYFSHLYTEGFYLAFTMMALYFLFSERLMYSALSASISSLSRMVGATLIIPYFWEAIAARKWKYLIFGLIIPVGALIYFLINQNLHGDPFYFLSIQKSNWHKESLNPFLMYWSQLKGFTWHQRGVFVCFDILLTLLFPFLLIAGRWRYGSRLPWSIILWSLAQFYIICSQSFWLSNSRYIFLIPSFYIGLAAVVGWKRWTFYPFLAGSTGLSLYAIWLFSRGAWLM